MQTNFSSSTPHSSQFARVQSKHSPLFSTNPYGQTHPPSTNTNGSTHSSLSSVNIHTLFSSISYPSSHRHLPSTILAEQSTHFTQTFSSPVSQNSQPSTSHSTHVYSLLSLYLASSQVHFPSDRIVLSWHC